MRGKASTGLPPFWVAQVVAWSAYGVLIYITLVPTLHEGQTWSYLLFVKTVRTTIGFALSFILHPLYAAVWRRTRAVGPMATVAILASGLFGAAWSLLYRTFGVIVNPASTGFTVWDTFPREVLDYAYVLFAWSACYVAVKYWQDVQVQKEKALAALALAHQAQLQMLRYQLSPHFLFNALNSIRALAGSDPAKAKLMVTELSEFLRYSLLETKAHESSVRDEVDAVRSYLAIEKIRFEERLEIEVTVDDEAGDRRIPGFLILPLVENAVKHGMREGAPLRVRLLATVDDGVLRIEVANTGSLEPTAERPAGFGIGLKNIRARLDAVAGAARLDLVEREGWICASIEIGGKTA